MEIDIRGGLRVSINKKDKTASIIKSPEAKGIILVPRFATHDNINYKIISIGGNSFENCNIEFLTFPEDSEIESFKQHSFLFAHIKKLRIPPKLKTLEANWCQFLYDLTDIEISPKNHLFDYFENKYLLRKSHEGSDIFDELCFARQDIVDAIIPSQIKTIKYLAFYHLKKIKTVEFLPNSKLECMEGYAFASSSIEKVTVTSKSVKICDWCFNSCNNHVFVSFPNAEQITFQSLSFLNCSEKAKILVQREAELTGAEKVKDKISYIEKSKTSKKKMEAKDNEPKKKGKSGKEKDDEDDPKKKRKPGKGKDYEDEDEPKKKSKSGKGKEKDYEDEDEPKKKRTSDKEKDDETLEKENDTLKKFVLYLSSRLSRYEETISYEEFAKGLDEGRVTDNFGDDDSEKEEVKRGKPMIGPDDEEFQEVVSKIGEGATSKVFKVVDKRTGKVMCKKVIKECNDDTAFKTLQNSLKEIETVQSIHHPCICESLGYNLQEELPQKQKEKDSDDDDYDYNDDKGKDPKTTIALFFELLPFSVKDVIEKGLMSNTLKVRIAVEVAFGMSHIHSRGMMHRDLKLENIMMNSVFNSKVIDFGLVHVADAFGGGSLTKGIGTLAYMSPEMVNEEDYDFKTDVYSYGIILIALFTGRLPKQSMRDKMTNVPMKYPTASSKISEFCIDLIKRCTSFEAEARPTFDEIIEDIFRHSFALAPDVDTELIKRRYQELNSFKALHINNQ